MRDHHPAILRCGDLVKCVFHHRSAPALNRHIAKSPHRQIITLAAVLIALVCCVTPAHGEPSDFLLVHRSMQVQSIRLTEIDSQYVIHMPRDKNWAQIPLPECIALLNPKASPQSRARGMMVLADGQRLPGEAVLGSKTQGETLAWMHQWLGRVEVPLNSIASVAFSAKSVPPPPGQGDVVLLANGDRQEGLIVSLGNPITLEPTGSKDTIDISLDLVSAVTMVSSPQPPKGRRIWFIDGTVIDVQTLAIGADGLLRMTGAWINPEANGAAGANNAASRQTLAHIAAILLDPNSLIPLSTLAPTRIEGPSTRYSLPKPQALSSNAPLNLSDIDIRGPLVVRYALPAGCQRFTADAELPRSSLQWGDLELVIRSDDEQVFRGRLNAMTREVTINVPTPGRELTFELLPGAHGPIQDRLVLHRPMLLKAR
jgi:hypothetical protein